MSAPTPRSTFLQWLFGHRPLVARLPVLQVEVTSRCFLNCTFCPNKHLGGLWQGGDMSWEVWDTFIVPALHHFELVYLQGWGEPLLHHRLWDMVASARAEGCRVGFTTCGGLLGEEQRGRILEAGVDLLGVSFAGATAETHERLRHGSHFALLCDNVAGLAAARPDGKPWLELHFLMLRSNIAELPAFVGLAAELGADEAVAINLSYAPSPGLASEAVFAARPDAAHAAVLEQARAEAERSCINFRAYPLVASREVLECDAHPCEAAYINHRGDIAPCVYLGLPVSGPVPRFYEGEDHGLSPMSWGHVTDGLMDVLQGPTRSAFCAPFRNRKRLAYSALSTLAALSGGDATPDLPPPPEPCRACNKMLGV